MAHISIGKSKVVFVTGGPGSGKTTQCQKIVQHFGLVHVTNADISVNTGDDYLKHDSVIKFMENSSTKHFLFDGFHWGLEEFITFEKMTGIIPEFILFLDCPEEVLLNRIMEKNGGDDDIEVIKHFYRESSPVMDSYEDKGLLRKVNASRPIDDVFKAIKNLFSPFVQDELLDLSRKLLRAIDNGDYATYEKLCDQGLTAYEPESQGQLLEGLPFHKFYFDMRQSGGFIQRVSTVAAPKVNVISEDTAVVTYTRLMQGIGTPLAGYTDSYNETRVWKRTTLGAREWEWKNVHFHRSKGPTNPEFYNVVKTP